jgi:hypothetical protein
MHLAPTYRVKCEGKEIATIQCLDRFPAPDSLWFWYGDGENTSRNPQPLDICKEDVAGHFKRRFAAPAPDVLDGDQQ